MTEVGPVNTLPKPWHDLENARKQRQRLREEIEKLRTTCEAEDGSQHVTECEKCYHKSLELIQSTYSEPWKKTWLSTRTTLRDDLVTRIQAVKDSEAGLEAVEERLDQEKKSWYREVLLENPDFLDLGYNDVRREDLLAALADPECHIDDIINPVWESLDKPETWSDDLEAFIEKLSSAGDDASALKGIYATELFKDKTTGAPLEHAQPYLDAFEGEGGADVQSLDQVLETLIRDLSAGKSTGSLRNTLRKRLDELSRAKTAFEQNKAAQAKDRSAAAAREAAAKALLEPLPPCYTCQGVVDKTQVLSCSHCQLALQMAGEEGREGKKLTVYCSEECLQKGQVGQPLTLLLSHVADAFLQFKHEEEDHGCSAKENCKSRTLVSEDVDMDADSQILSPVACAQCLAEKELTVFCSSECADANIADHRQSKHNVKTDPDDSSGTYTSMEEVVKMLDEATSGLKIQWHD
jgi:hypothetical protein